MYWRLQENVISERDLDELVSFIRTTKRFTQYTQVRDFENAFSKWQGCAYSVFVNSGSSANMLLLNSAKELYRWRTGDEVIVPALTWPTTITPVIQNGLTPVFADVNLTDLSYDYDRLHERISPRTRAIFVAHLLGFPADVERIKDVIGNRDIAILEDCCESQGARSGGICVGNSGSGSTFSFYWGHHMTTVEGGMLCTNDEDLYKLSLLKRSHGLARELPADCHADLREKHPDIDFEFLFVTDGFNFRNTEFSAVLGLVQLKSIDEYIRIRNGNYARFASICRGYPASLMVLETEGMSSFVLPFLFLDREEKKDFQKMLRSAGIESRPLIGGNLLRQPFLSQYNIPGGFPNADFLHTNAFYIGNNQFVDKSRLDGLGELLQSFFSSTRNAEIIR